MLGRLTADQPQLRLMNQCRRLERLAGLFLDELLGGQFSEFIVDRREQLVGDLRITPLDGRQDLREIAYGN